MANPEEKVNINLDNIARQLLQERFILTALELYTEITETGQEIPRLRDYFSNPSNFELCSKPSTELLPLSANLNRSSSQTTLDSLDWARYSEDGERAFDDRIAVLEFELRKARETIQGLRDNLTQATATSEVSENFIMFGARKVSSESQNGDLKPHEVCTLNFLINEYLVMRNYKMTANTFADENDNQDFENWDDVGLNIPRPPTLIQWLQDKVPEITPKTCSSCQTDVDAPQIDDLKASFRERKYLEERVKELESRCERQELELQKLHRKMSALQVMPLGTASESQEGKDIESGPDEDLSDRIEMDKTQVKYAKKSETKKSLAVADGEVADEGAPTSQHEDEKAEELLKSVVCAEQQKPDDAVVNEALNDEASYFGDLVVDGGSIEDLIENPSCSEDALDSTRDTVAARKLLNFQKEDQRQVRTPTEEESERQYAPEMFSEMNEVLDPRKCDRLPPLGASSECSPQGILAGEFISAQREEAKNLLHSSSHREVPQFLETQILGICLGQTLGVDSRLQNEVAALSLGQCDLLNLVSSSLHNIAPNVILAKREELLPLLVYSISQHANGRERERLLHLLFNLTKKPDREQRSTILLGLVNLARVLGADKLEAELLPQCWEQLSHKHAERRLLVAQSVAVLAPYTPPPLRNSLLLSMLQQLLGAGGEKETTVREAAMASLALLVAYLDDVAKIPPLVDTMLLCLQRLEGRSEGGPVERRPLSNAFLVLDALAHWAVKAGRLPQLVDPQLDRIRDVSKELLREVAEGHKRANAEQLNTSLANLVLGFSACMPYVFLFLFESLPPEKRTTTCGAGALPLTSSPSVLAFVDKLSVLLGGREEAERSLLALHWWLTSENGVERWQELSYILEAVLPRILETLSLLDASSRGVVTSFVDLVEQVCTCLGPRLRQNAVVPLFLDALHVAEGDIASVRAGASGLTKAPLVVYAVAILSETDVRTKEGELQQFLARQVSILALSGASTDALQLALLLLMEKSQCQEEVLGALWASVVHKATVVRAATAPLWALLVEHLQEAELASRVVPALVTLATDHDVTVRASTITPLAFIVANSSSKEVKDKVSLQLESVCEESQVMENPPLHVAIAQTCSSLAHNTPSHLLHNLFLPCLCRVALEGGGTPQEKLQFGTALLEALTALAPSPMPDHLVAHFVLPPLNQLQKTLGVMSYEHMETITVLTKEYTLRAQSSTSSERHRGGGGGLSSFGSSLSTSMGAMGAGLPIGSGVEDVKNRMSKMLSSTGRSMSSGLHGKTPSLALPSLFKKK